MNLANKITIVRILLIPLFVALMLYHKIQYALIVFGIAVISDALDGHIARMLNKKTMLGTILDPLADKLLLMSAFISVILIKDISIIRIPIYVLIIVISRDIILIAGVLLIYLLKGNLHIAPSILGKMTTFFQMFTIAFVLMDLKYAYIIWNIAIFFTVISGIDYIMKGSIALGERG